MRSIVLLSALFLNTWVGCVDPDTPTQDLPAETTEITFHLLPADAAPGELSVAFVAYQEGFDGPWKLMPGEGGVHKVKITSDRFGLAVGCASNARLPFGATSAISVNYSTVSEAIELRDEACFIPAAADRTRQIMVSGLGPNESVQFEYAYLRNAYVLENGPLTLAGPRGAIPAIAFVYDSPARDALPVRVLRLPDIDFAAPGQLAINLSGGSSLASAPVTAPEGVNVTRTRTVLRSGAATFIGRLNGTATRYTSVPSSFLRHGETIRITADISDGPFASRSSTHYVRELGPIAIEAVDPLPAVAPIVPPTGRRLFAMPLPELSNPQRYVDTWVSVAAGVNGARVTHSAKMSRGWRGDPALAYAFPDFSGLSGYASAMELPGGAAVEWALSRYDYNQRELTAGRVFLSSTRTGTIP